MTPANEKQARGRLTHLDDLLFIYCGESGSLAVQALRDNEPRVLIPFLCGESGIRTRDRLLAYIRFPGEPLQPLEHLSLYVSPYNRLGL